MAPYLETIPGVGGVSIFGRSDRTIRIWLDGDSMRSRGLSASDVLTALRREHVEVPGGLVEGAKIEWSVKTNAEFRSIEALERMVVSRAEGALIYLEDVARVEDGEADRRTIARFNGKPTVGITIQKQSGGNTVGIADEVKRRIAELAPLLPDGIELDQRTSAIDFSFGIRESIAETQFALVLGGLLAVLTVFVFLRRTKPTLIVASAIPISLIATFGVVWMFGYTLNTMTLLGMTLAIGVVIDDAIIVLENIERHRELGKSPRSAAADGTRQITIAATAATVSVAAVFLPVVFVEGIVGSFLGEFGLTVAAAVIVSLFVALTLTPMLAARMAPPKERAARQHLPPARARLLGAPAALPGSSALGAGAPDGHARDRTPVVPRRHLLRLEARRGVLPSRRHAPLHRPDRDGSRKHARRDARVREDGRGVPPRSA